jgi:hypothetical protein
VANANGTGWRNVVITALTSMVLTGLGAWMAWGQKAVSRDEVARMIETQGPYIEDRAMVRELRSAVLSLTNQVQQHGEQLARFGAVLERLERALEQRPMR